MRIMDIFRLGQAERDGHGGGYAAGAAEVATAVTAATVTVATVTVATAAMAATAGRSMGESGAVASTPLPGVDVTAHSKARGRAVVLALDRMSSSSSPGTWVPISYEPQNTAITPSRPSNADIVCGIGKQPGIPGAQFGPMKPAGHPRYASRPTGSFRREQSREIGWPLLVVDHLSKERRSYDPGTYWAGHPRGSGGRQR